MERCPRICTITIFNVRMSVILFEHYDVSWNCTTMFYIMICFLWETMYGQVQFHVTTQISSNQLFNFSVEMNLVSKFLGKWVWICLYFTFWFLRFLESENESVCIFDNKYLAGCLHFLCNGFSSILLKIGTGCEILNSKSLPSVLRNYVLNSESLISLVRNSIVWPVNNTGWWLFARKFFMSWQPIELI